MNKGIKGQKKGQLIIFLSCLFIIAGSLCGSIIYIIKPASPFSAAAKALLNGKNSLYTFAASCVLPYLILLSSALNFGIAISLILLLCQSFLSACIICTAINSGFSSFLLIKNIAEQFLLLLCCFLSSVFSINRVIKKFSTPSCRKPYLKREKAKTMAENIIVFSASTLLIVLYCFLKKS